VGFLISAIFSFTNVCNVLKKTLYIPRVTAMEVAGCRVTVTFVTIRYYFDCKKNL